jgi:hypothetical protein
MWGFTCRVGLMAAWDLWKPIFDGRSGGYRLHSNSGNQMRFEITESLGDFLEEIANPALKLWFHFGFKA